MADWSSLPLDLLSLITSHLLELPDLIRFSSICSHWRSIINNNNPLNPKHHPLPWLLLSSSSHHLDGNLRFFSLSEHRIYSFSLPKTLTNHYIFTSTHGWLIAASCERKKKQSFLNLVNPITRQTISLPPLSDLLPSTIKLLKSPPFGDGDTRLILVVKS